jgi:hypothetical protein
MRPIYVDYVPRWVPIVAGLLIVFGAWFGGNIAHLPLQTSTTLAIGLLGALIVAIFFQGRYYWRGQIKSLSTDGMRYVALTSVWIGAGRQLGFTPTEAKNWTAKAGTPGSDATNPRPSIVGFSLHGEKLQLNFLNPTLVDIDALSAINPAYFSKLRRDYPGLRSTKPKSASV